MTGASPAAAPHGDHDPRPLAPRRGRARRMAAGMGIALVLAAAFGTLRWVMAPALPPLWGALPEGADVYLHADLEALRSNPVAAWYLREPGAILPGTERSREPGGAADDDAAGNETLQFAEATGFRYQEHLHQLAVARKDDHWIGAARLSMDRRRFEEYLKQRAAGVSQLATAPVYTFGGQRPLRVALVSDRELVFSIGAREDGEDALAQAMLMLARRVDPGAAAASIENTLAASAVPRWRAARSRPLWVVGDGRSIFEPENAANRPTLSGFLLGAETLAGVETLLVSIEGDSLAPGIDGELICRPGVAPQPLADNLTLLASLLRPRAPEPGGRDLRPVWDALAISTQGSTVHVRWRPTPQMLGLLAAGGE